MGVFFRLSSVYRGQKVTRESFKLVVVISVFTLLAGAATSKRPATSKRIVSLDTVLSCADDELLSTAFNTDAHTAVRMNAVGMLTVEKDSQDYAQLRNKRFITRLVSESDSVQIWPTDFQGKMIDDNRLSFCRYSPTANFLKLSDSESKPYSIEIDGANWVLNPSEVFAHADQFSFTSGVFSNSSRVFLIARKGNVAIQFICNKTGLTFYRALYYQSGK
jgi:hypothetical protein